jgi:hypothetical protein
LYVFKTHVASIVTASAFETVSNCPCKTCRRDSTLMSFNYHPRSPNGTRKMKRLSLSRRLESNQPSRKYWHPPPWVAEELMNLLNRYSTQQNK